MSKYYFNNFPGLEGDSIEGLYDRLFNICQKDSDLTEKYGVDERLIDKFSREGMEILRTDGKPLSSKEMMEYFNVLLRKAAEFKKLTEKNVTA